MNLYKATRPDGTDFLTATPRRTPSERGAGVTYQLIEGSCEEAA